MMNKKGSLILRDVLFLMLIFSGIIVFASIFVNELAITYEDTDMQNEFAGSSLNLNATTSFYKTSDSAENVKEAAETGLGDLVLGGLKTAGSILIEIVTAPITFANMIELSLESMSVPTVITKPLGIIIIAISYILIGFVIISAFLQGGKL